MTISKRDLNQVLTKIQDDSEAYDDYQFEDVLILADKDSRRVVYANQKLLDITGYTIQELCEDTLHLFIKDDVIEDFYEKLRCNNGDNTAYDTYIKLKDGSYFPMNATFGCVLLDGEKYAYGVLKDFSTVFERLHYLDI